MNLAPASFSLSAWFESTELSWATAQYLLGGMGETCILIIGAMVVGLVLGTILASFQVYGSPWASRLVTTYVWFFRGVPILVLMFLFFFGFSTQIETIFRSWFGIKIIISPLWCAVIVLGLCSAAYQSQIFRGAMMSIPVGQFKAAQALGFTRWGAVQTIILPQAWRLSIPAWSNEYSILLKDSAIAYVIGVTEIMSRFKAVASTNHQTLLMYVLAGVLYFILTWIGVRLLVTLHHKTRIPGLAEMDKG